MSRCKKNSLRSLTPEERSNLEAISRSPTQAASRVARAKSLLAVADGETYIRAAQSAGRRDRETVSQLVEQFNRVGMSALDVQHGGGAQVVYGSAQRERILREIRRTPDREQDGTATLGMLLKILHKRTVSFRQLRMIGKGKGRLRWGDRHRSIPSNRLA
jgi:transposase